jgi:alkanesulfonate monooxygenase SsuD/methylene tetrahydromethanopterin reductase-like flavin-dependent oxidoreductase (luciferase family)
MDFGLNLPATQDWLNYAKAAEAAGFDEIRLQSDMAYYDSFSAYALGVTQTKSIRFMPYSNSVFLRHPILMASGAANIDNFAPGRIGVTYCSAGFETSIHLHIPDIDSIQACREAIEITRLLWSGSTISYKGKHWNLSQVKLPVPVRKGIPIELATRGSKFQLAGELADGIITHGKSEKYLKQLSSHLTIGAKKAKRDPKKITRAIVLPFLITPPEKLEATRSAVRGMLGAFVGGEYSLDWIDTLDLTLEDVQPLRKHLRSGKSFSSLGSIVSDNLLNRLIDAFAIIGTKEECITELESMRKNGITKVIPMLIPQFFPSESKLKKFIMHFSENIISSFK